MPIPSWKIWRGKALKLRVELLKKGQRIRELERELKKANGRWRRYYRAKDYRRVASKEVASQVGKKS